MMQTDILLRGLQPKSVHPGFFIIALSNEHNFNVCREHAIAGFPETDNGQWAYLDIDEGDYISFYFNGHLCDLFMVEKKYIHDRYLHETAYGT
ncbi:hypothetical protein, partial [Desulfovibrio sp.]